MRKRLLFLSAFFILGFAVNGLSQEPAKVYPPTSVKGAAVMSDVKMNTTAMKPADGTPAKFATKEEMEASLPKKIENIKELINSGQYTGERLQFLREELWRFENAIVTPK